MLIAFLWYIHVHVHMCEYVHDWRIHGSNVNEISIAIYMKSHNIEMMLHLILMKHTWTLF